MKCWKIWKIFRTYHEYWQKHPPECPHQSLWHVTKSLHFHDLMRNQHSGEKKMVTNNRSCGRLAANASINWQTMLGSAGSLISCSSVFVLECRGTILTDHYKSYLALNPPLKLSPLLNKDTAEKINIGRGQSQFHMLPCVTFFNLLNCTNSVNQKMVIQYYL